MIEPRVDHSPFERMFERWGFNLSVQRRGFVNSITRRVWREVSGWSVWWVPVLRRQEMEPWKVVQRPAGCRRRSRFRRSGIEGFGLVRGARAWPPGNGGGAAAGWRVIDDAGTGRAQAALQQA